MCFQNGEEPLLPFLEWRKMFPKGFPSIYLPAVPKIDESQYLKKGSRHRTFEIKSKVDELFEFEAEVFGT